MKKFCDIKTEKKSYSD